MWKKMLTATPVHGQHSATMVSTVACTVWLGPFVCGAMCACFSLCGSFPDIPAEKPYKLHYSKYS